MPAVKFSERLDLEQNSSFPDGHELILAKGLIVIVRVCFSAISFASGVLLVR
jgi:hypothetical protein